ncbi:hypothetical protein ABNC94_01150 [Paenibacillus larvae]
MNSGYLAGLLYVITLILYASGWKETLYGSSSQKSLLLFLWGYGLLGWFTWEGQYIGLSGGFVIIAVWIIGSILNIHIEMNRIHVLVVSGLLTVIGYLYEGIITKDPFFIIWNEYIDTAVLLGLLTSAALYNPIAQIGCLTLILIILDLWKFRERIPLNGEIIGGGTFRDMWWAAVVTVRVTSILIQKAVEESREKVAGWMEKKRGAK